MNKFEQAINDKGYTIYNTYWRANIWYETVLEVYSKETDELIGEYDTDDKCWIE